MTLILSGISGITGHQDGVVLINGGADRDMFSTISWLALSGERPSERFTAWVKDGSLWISLLNCICQPVVEILGEVMYSMTVVSCIGV